MRASFLTIRPSPSSAIESFTFPRRLDAVMRTSQTPLLAPPVAPLVLSPRHENETPSYLRDELRREDDRCPDYSQHDPSVPERVPFGEDGERARDERQFQRECGQVQPAFLVMQTVRFFNYGRRFVLELERFRFKRLGLRFQIRQIMLLVLLYLGAPALREPGIRIASVGAGLFRKYRKQFEKSLVFGTADVLRLVIAPLVSGLRMVNVRVGSETAGFHLRRYAFGADSMAQHGDERQQCRKDRHRHGNAPIKRG